MTLMLHRFTAALTLATLAFTALPLAGQPAEPGAHFILNWDLDGDGAVTLAEARQKRGELHTMFDQNDDGALDAEEYAKFDEVRAADIAANTAGGPAMRQVSAGMAMELNDADENGLVTEDEFVAGADDWFARMDRDGDGLMTTDDFGPSARRGIGQGQGRPRQE
ncbi:MAG: EF-hand domain-containing protein [Paracoccaceae bacterium]|jgi:Ca2+-binding EF-hand superfamily protein|nr:EF-hand domain-containing protein [Paracoccaceae bacterium]